MADHCCTPPPVDPRHANHAYRRVLWIALIVNAAMFAVEIAGSVASSSVSLLADATDFLGDAASYGISIAVLSLGLAWRARAALVKGLSMGAYGVFVLAQAGFAAAAGVTPEPVTMGAIALLALAANVGVAIMLFAHRGGDANMRSVWICSRNDAINNLLVIGAGFAVLWTGSGLPDLIVAFIMAALGISGGWQIVRHSLQELKGHN
jgi:Co/Zn/Cd efflux system component